MTDRRSVTVLWSNPSQYLSDCLDVLRENHEVRVVYATDAPLPAHAVAEGSTARARRGGGRVDIDARTDVLLVGGWRNRHYLAAARRARKAGATTIIAFDTQAKDGVAWGACATLLGLRLRSVFQGAFVPGDRQEQTARKLGFDSSQIQQGLYACGSRITDDENTNRPPFIWVGRLVPVKALGVFLDAYEEYRRRVGEQARDAVVVGDGVDRKSIASRTVSGLTWLGQREPDEVRTLMREAACLVSSSTKEPWGMVIVEAAAAGLPVICTDAAGAGDHLVQAGINGRVVAAGDIHALADALVDVGAAGPAERRAMQERSIELAADFTAQAWAERLLGLVHHVSAR